MVFRRRYQNYDDLKVRVSIKSVLAWQKERLKQKDLSFKIEHCKQKKISFINSNHSIPALTWIGHATFLIQYKGLNIITDPVWASRLGFEKRLSAPGLDIEQLPSIDVVLISHNHYDHLDFASIKKLNGTPVYLIPEGLGRLFYKRRLFNFREFRWWQDFLIKDVNFSFIPSQHWTKRGLFDTDKTLWGSWILDSKFYFVGDSGYFRGFKEVGQKFHPEIFLGPIGCYEPEWITKAQHMTPEESVQAYLDCKAKVFIPMHYDAYRLAVDTPKEALDRLNSCWQKLNLPQENLKIMQLGETLLFNC